MSYKTNNLFLFKLLYLELEDFVDMIIELDNDWSGEDPEALQILLSKVEEDSLEEIIQNILNKYYECEDEEYCINNIITEILNIVQDGLNSYSSQFKYSYETDYNTYITIAVSYLT